MKVGITDARQSLLLSFDLLLLRLFRPVFHIFHSRWLLLTGFFRPFLVPLSPIWLATLSTAGFRRLDLGYSRRAKVLVQVLGYLLTLGNQGALAPVVNDHMRQPVLQNLNGLVLLQRQSHV